MKWVYDLKNKIDFFIREKTKFSRKAYREPEENKEGLFQGKALKREKELKSKYESLYLNDSKTVQNYKENLYILDILDKYLEIQPEQKLKVLDIGCKNWFYVKGEYAFLKKHIQKLEICGIEIDAYRLYSNFYSRFEVARFYMKNLENTKYIADDFLNYNQKFDLMLWFLPFIKEYPHMRWGLPLKNFVPQKMLWHAYFSLNKDGKIFIVNQGVEEYEIQKKLLEECAIPYIEIGEIKSDFLCYNHKRYALLVYKKSVEEEDKCINN